MDHVSRSAETLPAARARRLGIHVSRIRTKKAYAGYLEKWIEPRWVRYAQSDIRAVEVELWLKNLDRAPGTCCKVRNVCCSIRAVGTTFVTATPFSGLGRVPNATPRQIS